MFYLEISLFMQGLLIVLMLIFIHKMNQVKGQIDSVTNEVKKYLNFIEADVDQEQKNIEKTKVENIPLEEAQNHLIQAVLKEYFP